MFRGTRAESFPFNLERRSSRSEEQSRTTFRRQTPFSYRPDASKKRARGSRIEAPRRLKSAANGSSLKGTAVISHRGRDPRFHGSCSAAGSETSSTRASTGRTFLRNVKSGTRNSCSSISAASAAESGETMRRRQSNKTIWSAVRAIDAR